MTQQRLTKRERRLLREQGSQSFDRTFDYFLPIKPLTENQSEVFDAFNQEQNLFLHGTAGTGKTFLAMGLTLRRLYSSNTDKRKVYIVRSAVPSRDMGFLPGNQKEKMRAYEQPYISHCTKLFNRGDAYEVLVNKDIIEFLPTSFVRGTEFNDCYVIVDECQNMDAMELHSIMTRAGENCTFIFCGDFAQDDLTSERKKEKSGIIDFMKIINEMPMFTLIDFKPEDIVRSELVKQYIMTRERLGISS